MARDACEEEERGPYVKKTLWVALPEKPGRHTRTL